MFIALLLNVFSAQAVTDVCNASGTWTAPAGVTSATVEAWGGGSAGGGATGNVSDQIVVYNLGISGASAYTGNTAIADNRRQVSAVGTNNLSIISANPLPFSSPSDRFQVVTTPVSYV